MSLFLKNIIQTIKSSNAGLNPMQSGTLTRLIDQEIQESKLRKLLEESLGRAKLTILNHYKVGQDLYLIETNDTFAKFRTVNTKNKSCSSKCSNDLETQFLIALGEKYDGDNSQFAYFACKMLNKEIE